MLIWQLKLQMRLPVLHNYVQKGESVMELDFELNIRNGNLKGNKKLLIKDK